VHGYRIVAMSCVILLIVSAIIVAATVRNPVLTAATPAREG
jgi:hypothetical protein